MVTSLKKVVQTLITFEPQCRSKRKIGFVRRSLDLDIAVLHESEGIWTELRKLLQRVMKTRSCKRRKRVSAFFIKNGDSLSSATASHRQLLTIILLDYKIISKCSTPLGYGCHMDRRSLRCFQNWKKSQSIGRSLGFGRAWTLPLPKTVPVESQMFPGKTLLP